MFTEAQLQKYQKKDAIEKYIAKIEELITNSVAKFNETQDEVEKELVPIDKTNMIKETNNNIHLYHKYLSRLSEERLTYNNLRNKRTEMEGELYDFYRNHSDISSKLRSESAIEKYVNSHPCYSVINKLVMAQDTFVKYLESVTQLLRDRGFSVKNVIDAVKIEMGMM